MLSSSNPKTLCRGLVEVAQQNAVEVYSEVWALSASADEGVRGAGVYASGKLSRTDPESAYPRLTVLLNDPESVIRSDAAIALAIACGRIAVTDLLAR